jgi:Rrf2 family iron-sulfur cluster assembly transcriptional regulator
MRLEVSRRADLASRALLLLAKEGERLKAGELAARIGTTAGFLSQVLTPLVARGWVRSEPGPRGGYLATPHASNVSLLEVIEAIEGPTDTERCVLEDRPCGGAAACPLHRPWDRARGALLEELRTTPLVASALGAPS